MKQRQEKLFSDQYSEEAGASSESLTHLDTAEITKQRSRRPLFLLLIIISLLLLIMVFWRISLNNPLQQTSDSPSKNEANDIADISNWQTYQNDAYSYSLFYPSELKIFSNSADVKDAEVTSIIRSMFIAQAQDAEPYLNRYLDFEVFQLKPTFGSGFTEYQTEIDHSSGWKYQPSDTSAPFTPYVFQLGEQSGYLQVLVSNDPTKADMAMQILSSLSWTQKTTNNEVTTNSGTSFQQLLATSCHLLTEGKSNSGYESFGISLANAPVEFSNAVNKKYNITNGLLCEAGGIAFASARENGSAFISAQTSGEQPVATLYVGDKHSINGGMRTPQLSLVAQDEAYYAPYSRTPHVITNPEGLKTIVSLLGAEPYCPTENSPMTLEFLTYRELGELKILVSRVIEFPLDAKMREMFIQFASSVSNPGDAGNPYKGEYELCESTEFEKTFYARYLSGYTSLAPQFKAIVDENTSDILGLSLKQK